MSRTACWAVEICQIAEVSGIQYTRLAGTVCCLDCLLLASLTTATGPNFSYMSGLPATLNLRTGIVRVISTPDTPSHLGKRCSFAFRPVNKSTLDDRGKKRAISKHAKQLPESAYGWLSPIVAEGEGSVLQAMADQE